MTRARAERRRASEAERAAGSGKAARAWLRPVLGAHKRRIALATTAVLTGTGAGLLMPLAVKVAVDRGVTASDLHVLDLMVAAYLGLAAVAFVAQRAETLLVAQVGERALLQVRSMLFRHLQRLSVDFYERERTGRIVARMTNDIEAMSNLVTNGLVTLITSLVTLLGIAGFLLWLDWQLALATLVVAPLVALAADRFRVRSKTAWREVRERATTVTIKLQELLAGVRTIQAFRRERATAADLAEANDAERRAHNRTIVIASYFFPGIEFVGTVASVVVLGFGGRRVLTGDLEVGTLVAFLLYLRNLFDPVQQLSELYDQLQSATAGAERVGSILSRTPSVRDEPDAAALPDPDGAVRLSDVTFAYGTGEDDAEASPVLHGIDLDVPAGSTLALVGPTGAGKSTIAKLIARFYDPQHGSVSVDGIDVRHVRLADLRAAMGYVPQEGFLFSSFGDGTVADNIRYGRPDATRPEVEAAAKAVGADEVIRRLPQGYDTEVGERGVLLSVGERQLVAFARAWIADPKVLILDEATSNLDVVTERRIQHALRRLRHGRTTIIIAHRLTTVADADQIAVIEDGRVQESGSPAELRERGGRFAELYERWLAGAA
jgi:ATP-binding cassette, subfamily B, bacterial